MGIEAFGYSAEAKLTRVQRRIDELSLQIADNERHLDEMNWMSANGGDGAHRPSVMILTELRLQVDNRLLQKQIDQLEHDNDCQSLGFPSQF